uniref:Trans-1,2-dihydrobenzene-1,2-diol dehydrogenase n=1 Tax=Geospiza parvula TaxID=87175 RepID=A0A8C3MK78_GEOPR
MDRDRNTNRDGDEDRNRNRERAPEPPCPSPERPRSRPGPTRWGICSAGAISHDFVLALRTLPPEEHTVAAVAARDLGRARDFAQHFGVPRAYGSYEELAQDPGVDVVYVGVVNPAHLPVGLLFLRRGRPVLMEKPMALGAREVAQLVGTARDEGVFLMEGFWTRFFPAWRRLRSLARGGGAGVAPGAAGSSASTWGVPRLREPRLGGGVLLDLGGYGIQTVILGGFRVFLGGFWVFLGWISVVFGRISGVSGRILGVFGVDFCWFLGGFRVFLGLTPPSMPPPAADPHELPHGAALGRRERFPLPPPAEPLNFPHSTGLRYEAQHVRECLLQGLTESPEMPLAESEVIARLLDQAREQVGLKTAGVTAGVTTDPPE